jgi:hypothetical protein
MERVSLRGASTAFSVLVASLALLMAGLVSPADAAEQGAAPVEGESFTKPAGTQVVLGGQYSGGKALKISSGQAVPTKQVTITKTSKVLVRAHAGQRGGSPTLAIRVDGASAGTRRISSNVLSEYLYSGITLQPGTYKIGLKGGNIAQGRNVFVDVVNFPAVAPPADTTAPEIQFYDIYNNPPVSGRDRVSFGSSEPVQFTCALQDLSSGEPATFAPCTDPIGTAGFFTFDPSQYDGRQVKFYVRAVDAAGNVTEETLTWKVDAEFPTIAITSGPEEGATVNTRSVSFGWTASDNLEVHDVQCHLVDGRGEPIYVDGSAGSEDYQCGGTSYTGESRNPATFSNLADGQYTFGVSAFDKAGQAVGANRTFTVDATP